MKIWPSVLFTASLILIVGIVSCDVDKTTVPDPGENWSNESPEKVLGSLTISYRRGEIESYAALLDPDFRFYFQDGDEPPELGRDYWVAVEDSTGTEALFNSPSVSNITIDLTYGDAAPDTLERSPDPLMWIRVTPMRLVVDDVDGTTFLVTGDIQDMYFRQGTGANSEEWYLYEWRDIPGGRGIGSFEHGVYPKAVAAPTWGWLKQVFVDPVSRDRRQP